jgi:UDP-glucose 4-epimerase
MNILVTGATGFIGKAICSYLSKNHAITRVSSKICNLNDMGAADVLTELMVKNDIKTVIHAAAKVCTSENREEIRLFEDNVHYGFNVINACRRHGVETFINISSMAVYPLKDGLYEEDVLPEPSLNGDGLYGMAKWQIEQMADFYLGSKCKVVHARLTQVFGPGMRDDRIFPSFIKEIEKANSVTIFGEGERISNFIHINDVVNVVDHMVKAPKPGVYNVGAKDHWTLRQWAMEFIKVYGRADTRLLVQTKGSKIKQLVGSAKLKSIYGLENKTMDVRGLS